MAKYPGVMSPIAKQPKPSLRDKLIPPLGAPGAPGAGGVTNWMGGSSGAGGAGYAPGGGGYAGGMPDIFKSPGDKGGGTPLGPFGNAPGGGFALPDAQKKPPENGLFGGLTKPIGTQPAPAGGVTNWMGGNKGTGGITSSPVVDKEPNFWNAERMKAAQPMASNLPDAGGGVPAGVPQPANMPTAATGPVNRQLAAPTNAPLTGGGTYNRRAAGDPTVGPRRPQSATTPEQRANYATTHYGQGTQNYENNLTNATRRASPEFQSRIAGNAAGIAGMQQQNAALAAAAADPHRTAWYQQLHDMGGAAGGALPWEEYARQQGWDTNRNFGYYGQHGATSDQQGGYTDNLGIWRTGSPPAPLTPPPNDGGLVRTGGAVDANGNVTNLPPFDPNLNVNQGPLFDNGPIMQQIQQSPYYGQLMQLLMQLFGGGIA